MHDQLEHAKAAVGLAVTGGTLIPAWLLSDIDLVLRIALTVVGIAAGLYSVRYYRCKLELLEKSKQDDE